MAGGQRQADAQGGAGAGAAVDVQAATGGCHALMHAGQAATEARRRARQSDAVVADAASHGGARLLKTQLDMRGVRMAGNVRQRFLHHVIQQGAMRAAGGGVELVVAAAADAGGTRKVGQQFIACRLQARVEGRRAQVMDDAAQRRDGQVDIARDHGQLLRQLGRRLMRAGLQHGQVDLQGQQMLAQVVVDVAPDAQAFLLARLLLPAGQARLLAVLAQLFQRLQAQRQAVLAPQQQRQRTEQDGAGRHQGGGRAGRRHRSRRVSGVQGGECAGCQTGQNAQTVRQA
ncbi:hypothetical protein D3C72_1118790 [compost metagenome]